MTMDLLTFLIALNLLYLPFAQAESTYKTYEGYKIYDIWAKTDDQAFELQTFYENNGHDIDVLIASRSRGQAMRLLTTPEQEVLVTDFVKAHELDFNIVNENVMASIVAEQNRQTEKLRMPRSGDANIDFESYQRFDDIDNYLEYLVTNYPKSVHVETIGQSYEGRDLKTILIRHSASVDEESSTELSVAKPLIVIDAGIHAREWIAPAAALYVIQQLVENSTYHEEELKSFDWLIWPLVNPDGYEYTHQSERFWRKTRQPSGNCYGTDANRNFDFHWGGLGTSDDPCSEIFKGPTAFSEPETVALRELLFRVNSTCRMYLTLHSYGNYLLYPWGYEATLPPTWRYLDAVAKAGAEAIRSATGTFYEVGSSTNVLYAAAGASDDYAFGVANISVSITMELPAGGSGFDPAASKIGAIVDETWVGIKAMAAKVHEVGDHIEDFLGDGNNAANSLRSNVFWKLFF